MRKASDVTAIREYTRKLLIAKYGPNATSNHPTPRIISKIESTEALVNFDEILAVSDAIMVARGDLGIEIPMECVANVQKEIVAKSNLAGRPVVVATQMLESMQKNPRPTRAECTDVYNAVLDGADCVMLSGESAKGKYPSQSVGTMKKIVDQAELWTHANPNNVVVVSTKPKILDPDHGFAYGIVEASKNINASCIISIVRTGITAENISFYRPNVPIVTVVPNAKLGRLLQLHRGIHPIIAPENLTSTSKLSLHDRCEIAVREAKQAGFCKSGDHVVLSVTDTASQNISRAKTMRVITVL